MIELKVMRRELARLLSDHGLSWTAVQDDREWAAFSYLYTSIVSDVELAYSKGDLLPQEVETLRINKIAWTPEPLRQANWIVKVKGRDKPFMGGSIAQYLHLLEHKDFQF